jgi:hypothetical protein
MSLIDILDFPVVLPSTFILQLRNADCPNDQVNNGYKELIRVSVITVSGWSSYNDIHPPALHFRHVRKIAKSAY